VVANDFDYVMRNGGIGTYNWLIAHLLAQRGWYVHVLYCGRVRRRKESAAVATRLGAAGIGWSCLDDFDLSEEAEVTGISEIFNVELSERVRLALEELHRQHHFDLAEFGEWGALGFRPIQARRIGVAFADLPMAVKLHSSSQWMREGNHKWLADSAELEVDFCERYAFEHADVQLSPSAYMLDYARQNGWKVRPDARVVTYPFSEPQFLPTGASGPMEVVFFGRLETRKGLEVFLKAAANLDPAVPITFLGRVNALADGRPATELIREKLRGRRYTLRTNCNREQALSYLSQGNRLAVIASLADNSPFTVIECCTNKIPFIASGIGGIPELVRDPQARQRLLFEPNARDLLRCLRATLAADPTEAADVRERLSQDLDVAENNRRVGDAYYDIAAAVGPASRGGQESAARQAAPTTSPSGPLVSVAVPHYNLGQFLPEALASLAAQTYPHLEVLVIDDGSTDPYSQAVFAQQESLYPQFRFLRQENSGIGATRNRGLYEARGEFFIPMDADNIARPEMVARYAEALARNTDLSALTCYYLAFEEKEELQKQEYTYAYRPTGGPHVLASLKNVYGDANAIFRTEAFRAAGGYETDRDTSWEDWEAFVKLVNAGHKIDIVPEYLFYYRHLETGFSRVTDHYLNQRRVLRQYFRRNNLTDDESVALWSALISLQQRNCTLALRLNSLRYRVADGVHSLFALVPGLKPGVRWLLRSGERAWQFLRTQAALW
jgi:glycosyltransferase involved in cell wall biosynthesis